MPRYPKGGISTLSELTIDVDKDWSGHMIENLGLGDSVDDAKRRSELEGLAIFGDGSDGDVTISSDTTLSRDMFYNDLTIDAGVTLTTAGYRIFVKGTLTNNGTIRRNGNNGSDGSSSAGGAGAAALANATLGGSGAGGDGAFAGSVNTGTAGGGGGSGGGVVIIAAKVLDNSSGTIQANGGDGGNAYAGSTWGVAIGNAGSSVDPGRGGNGGDGGNAQANGGSGGIVTAALSGMRALPVAISGWETEVTAGLIKGGAGGGGGAVGQTPSQGAGGGGGGGGGAVILIYNSLSAGTEQANGGNGGTAIGMGSAGSAGSNGTVIKIANA